MASNPNPNPNPNQANAALRHNVERLKVTQEQLKVALVQQQRRQTLETLGDYDRQQP